jgi:hypothetical protein
VRRTGADWSLPPSRAHEHHPARQTHNPQQASPPRAERSAPATFDDLPDDVLPHILALLPQEDRFRAALACRALARAARPPSAAWTDIEIGGEALRDTDGFAPFLSNLRAAGHFVKKLEVRVDNGELVEPAGKVLTAVAAPHLESLLVTGKEARDVDVIRSVLASASRLTHFKLDYFSIFAPCGLPATVWTAVLDSLLRHEGGMRKVATVATAVAPAAVLSEVCLLGLVAELRVGGPTDKVDAFVAVAQAGLTRLTTGPVDAEKLPILVGLVNRLPRLVELEIDTLSFSGTVDLTALSAPSLERLNLKSVGRPAFDFPDAVAARLNTLSLRYEDACGGPPPRLLLHAGARFTRLTRLEYGMASSMGSVAHLGPWSNAALYKIETLVHLTAVGDAFTLDGQDGRAWAAGVVHETLPRLAKLRLISRDGGEGVSFACRARRVNVNMLWIRNLCPTCGAVGVCAGGEEVRAALFEALPAAAAEGGRQLRVVLEPLAHSGTESFHMRFEAAPPPR